MATSAPVELRVAATAERRKSLYGKVFAPFNRSGYDGAILAAVFVYLAVIGGLMLAHEGFVMPDQFFVLALAGLVISGHEGTFLRDWTPPILLLVGYDCLRGALPDLVQRAHILPMIRFDRWLFGAVPTNLLQARFFRAGHVQWYDVASVIVYLLHFFAPLLVALFFWLIDRPLFKQYMTAMVLVSYMAFITYCVYPAMPPWMAAQKGYIPHVYTVMNTVLASFGHPVQLPTVYQFLGVDLVAAVPSLHAAFPLMMALFVRRRLPKWGWLAFLYPAVVWLTIVYMGEHYVFDIVAAAFCTMAVYMATTNWRRLRAAFSASIAFPLPPAR